MEAWALDAAPPPPPPVDLERASAGAGAPSETPVADVDETLAAVKESLEAADEAAAAGVGSPPTPSPGVPPPSTPPPASSPASSEAAKTASESLFNCLGLGLGLGPRLGLG